MTPSVRISGVDNVVVLTQSLAGTGTTEVPEDLGMEQLSSILTAKIKSLVVTGAMVSTVLLGSTSSVQAQSSSQFGAATSISSAVSSALETRLLGGRNGIGNFGDRRRYSANIEESITVPTIGGEPYSPFATKTLRYSEVKQTYDKNVKSLDLSADVSVHIRSEYVKLKTVTGVSTYETKGGYFMSENTPTFIRLYAEELTTNLKHQPLKLAFTALFTAIVSWLGVPFVNVLTALIIFAIVDLILSLIPGNVKPGTEKDNTIQAKLLSFATNFIAILAFIKGGEYIKAYYVGEGSANIVATTLNYAITGWIVMIYSWRIVNYVARANKTKVPKFIKKYFEQ